MMGIAIDGSCSIFCDNQAVTKNVSALESTLSKKHNAIAYHLLLESVMVGTVRVTHEDGATNLADILTKPLAAPRRKELLASLLW